MFDRQVAQPVQRRAQVRANIRAQRARVGITQASVARRMRQLGFDWYPQTVGLVERNQRPLLDDERDALALCLETRPEVLALPPTDVAFVLFGEQQIPAQRLSVDDGSVTWDGDELRVSPATAARAEAAYLKELVQAPLPGYPELRRRVEALEGLIRSSDDQEGDLRRS